LGKPGASAEKVEGGGDELPLFIPEERQVEEMQMDKEKGDGEEGEEYCEVIEPLANVGLRVRESERGQLGHRRAARSGHSPLIE
jgi:hypothetical protein